MKPMILLLIGVSLLGVTSSFSAAQRLGDAESESRARAMLIGSEALQRGDFTAAYQAWLPLARDGHAAAQANIAWMSYTGQGVAQNFEEAARWYRAAADQRHPSGENGLGLLYLTGRGVDRDHAEALKWLTRAAEQNYASAQVNLGLMHAEGLGVAVDDNKAITGSNGRPPSSTQAVTTTLA